MASLNITSSSVFATSGPTDLTPQLINWASDEHRRRVAACLVKGASTHESDRKRGRSGARALAPAWWESFHFTLREEFVDYKDRSIFGVVYEHVPPGGAQPPHPSAPRYVVALRGTKIYSRRDIAHDSAIVFNFLERMSRNRDVLEAVGRAVDTVLASKAKHSCECEEVWLAGHSLGASLATLAGKHMAQKRSLILPTFLFNPPRPSVLPFMPDSLRPKVSAAISLLKAFWELVHRQEHKEKAFAQLSAWTPSLYLHRDDAICNAYVEDLDQRKKMEAEGRVDVARWSAPSSYWDHLLGAFGVESQRVYLIPSCRMWVNAEAAAGHETGGGNMSEPHRLRQWWQSDAELNLTFHRCDYGALVPEA